MFDPYEILGVKRDADTAAVRKAYRRRAKRAHPDHGGSADKFNTLHRALVVLTDEKKRAQFDRDGTIDERPDNAASDAAGVVLGLIGGLLQSRGSSIFQIDLIVVLKRSVQEIIGSQQAQLAVIENNIALGQKVASKIKRKDGKPSLLHLMLEQQIETLKGTMVNPRRIIAQHKDALALLDQLEYEPDVPTPSSVYPVGREPSQAGFMSMNDMIFNVRKGV